MTLIFFEIGAIIKLHPPSVTGQPALEKECMLSYTICFKWPHKKSHKGLSPVTDLAIKLVNYDLLKKPLTKCNSTWWILSVGRVEDDIDKDVILVRAAFSKL
jgi:hypothetical protein